MGQITYAIMYGAKAPRKIWDKYPDEIPDGEPLARLLDEYEQYCRKEIDAIPQEDLEDYECAKYRFVPQAPGDYQENFIGFYIACGGSGKPGIPDLPDYGEEPLILWGGAAQGEWLRDKYKKEMEIARKRWSRFEIWA